MASTGDSTHLAGVPNPSDSPKPIAMVPNPMSPQFASSNASTPGIHSISDESETSPTSVAPISDVVLPGGGLPIKNLPSEVRGTIYIHEVALAPGRQLPALLIALGSCKDWGEDYKEAQRLYRAHNFVVSKDSEVEFQNMSRKALWSIRHLTMVLGPQYDTLLLDIKHARAFIRNNLSSLTIEKTGVDPTNKPYRVENGSMEYEVTWIVAASIRGVDRLVVSTREGLHQDRSMAWSRIRFWGSGIVNKYKVEGLRVRVWEREDHLRLTPWKEIGGPPLGRELDAADWAALRNYEG
ncbi:hypothetical protein DL95DRAFT_464548 [Leptodontidium sp. 2 PMI_412]|nr:hypothetical protein DL95DRAFT_464548 [Leptodontidium sp. 2 PMI_412]